MKIAKIGMTQGFLRGIGAKGAAVVAFHTQTGAIDCYGFSVLKILKGNQGMNPETALAACAGYCLHQTQTLDYARKHFSLTQAAAGEDAHPQRRWKSRRNACPGLHPG